MEAKLVLLLLIGFCASGFETKEVSEKENTKLSHDNNVPKNITTKSVIGYFVGTFKNDHNNVTVDVEFQVRLAANDSDETAYLIFDNWNYEKINITTFAVWLFTSPLSSSCGLALRNDCNVPFPDKELTRPFDIKLHYYNNGKFQNSYSFLEFPSFIDSFILTNATGQCTKNQWYDPEYRYGILDRKLYKYCLCAGTEYNPDPSLGCPKNPWA